MQTVIANRNDFFLPDSCPIALRTIRGDAPVQHEGDLTDIRHTHDFSELIIIAHGCGNHWIDGNTYPVSEGDVFLIQGNTEHCFIERHGLAMYNIMFDDFYLKNHLRTLRSLPGFNVFFLFEPTYRRRHRFKSHLRIPPAGMIFLTGLLNQMVSELAAGKPGCDLILLSKVLEIFVFISREYLKNGNSTARPLFRLGELTSRLERDYRDSWNIAKISRIAAMAPTTLIPVFKKVTGYSPIDYLLRIRLSKAADSLLRTDDGISEIAEECGFSDSNYFSRQFRKHFGCSPRDYRSGNSS